MSPEAAAGRAHEADGRSDVYSLGVILYELICGRKPSEMPSGTPHWKAATRIATPPTPRSVDRAIPAALDKICMKALAFEAADRYPTAKLLADDLTRHLATAPKPKPSPKPKPKSRPIPVEVHPDRGGWKVGLLVAASVFCMILGMSVHVATRRPSAIPGLALVSALNVNPIGEPTPKPVEEPTPPVVEAPVAAVPAAETPTPAAETPVVAEVPVPKVESAATPEFTLVGNKETRKFHRPGCNRGQVREKNRETLRDAAAAKEKGYSPCSYCRPSLDDPAPNTPPAP